MFPKLIGATASRVEGVRKTIGERNLARFLLALRWATLAAILLFLIYRLTEIGWIKIIESRPTSLWFYLLSIVMFMVLPITDKINYRIMTGYHVPSGLKIFSRKQVFNEAVVSYAGETYLCPKLAALPEHNTRKALIAIKDNTLISAFVSNSWTIVLVLCVWLFGHSDILKQIWNLSPILIGGFGIFCILLYLASMILFRKLISRSMSEIWRVIVMHGARIFILAALQVTQWWSAMPATGLSIWIMFLAVQTLVKRVPINGDLIFLGVALSLPGFDVGDGAAITAMLVAAAAMNQLVHFGAFILTSDFKRSTKPFPLADKALVK